jgi:mannose-6-phosphate isomerase-like protein (cupin superfamily)
MTDYTVKQIDEMEAIYAGSFKRARAELGVSSFGMQVIDFPPHVDEQYPAHDHADDGQEEVYLALRGSGEIEIAGERHRLDPETMVRVGPGVMRTIRTGEERMRLLALGGVPAKVYEPPEMSKLGSPDPLQQRA